MRAQRTPAFSWSSFLRISLVALGAFGIAGADGDACTIRIVIDNETHDDHTGEGEGEGEYADSDFDALDDATERTIGTDPYNADTDGDGLLDGEESCTIVVHSVARDAWSQPRGIFCTDPLNPDSDFDGLLDGDEIYVTGTDPLNPDSDFDGILDGDDDNWVTVVDSDGDGLDDDSERTLGTDPFNADTDGDGLLDGQESCGQPVPSPPCPDLGRPVEIPACEPGFSAVPVDACGFEWVCVQDAVACPDIFVEPPTCAEGEIAVALDACALEWTCVADDGTQSGSSGESQQDVVHQNDDATQDDAQQDSVGAAPVMPWSCTDPRNADSDVDGLTDGDELYFFGTDPLNPDTDGDGVLDGDDRDPRN